MAPSFSLSLCDSSCRFCLHSRSIFRFVSKAVLPHQTEKFHSQHLFRVWTQSGRKTMHMNCCVRACVRACVCTCVERAHERKDREGGTGERLWEHYNIMGTRVIASWDPKHKSACMYYACSPKRLASSLPYLSFSMSVSLLLSCATKSSASAFCVAVFSNLGNHQKY